MRGWIERLWRGLGFVSRADLERRREEVSRLERELDALAARLRHLDAEVEPHEPQVRIHHGPPPRR